MSTCSVSGAGPARDGRSATGPRPAPIPAPARTDTRTVEIAAADLLREFGRV